MELPAWQLAQQLEGAAQSLQPSRQISDAGAVPARTLGAAEMSNRSPRHANQVSLKKFWIWKIQDWRPGVRTGRLAPIERNFSLAETDAHAGKRRKSRVFS